MRYYEVIIADGKYRASSPLVYQSVSELQLNSIVTVPVRNRMATGLVTQETAQPRFVTKEVKTLLSQTPLPGHCLELARWLQGYYHCTLGESLRQFAPSRPVVRRQSPKTTDILSSIPSLQLELTSPLTPDQKRAIKEIGDSASTTVLLHGETGTGKTRVYLELARGTLASGHSVVMLTPEIALTSQLALAADQYLQSRIYVLHSQLSEARRKKIWLEILEAKEPIVVIGPRSALFSPINSPGLVIIDEAHEPAYKQDQAPRYHANRVASQLGLIINAKVVLGTATPSIAEYFVASERHAIVKMNKSALKIKGKTEYRIVDQRKAKNFGRNPHLSDILIDEISSTLSSKKQVMLYLNRRGSARIILCTNCGWQFLCPNCDIPLVYHADDHSSRCHICGFASLPPPSCPDCKNIDIIYKSIGTKALADIIAKLFPAAKIRRFDSDTPAGERINEAYAEVVSGGVDIIIGTQLLAKGLDLPQLGLVGIVSAETSLSLPDYTSEERTFQLLYQTVGRIGRGHASGKAVIQSYDPEGIIIRAATGRDYKMFYEYALPERRDFRFPPFSYLMRLKCRRATIKGAEQAAGRLKEELLAQGLPVEIIGPAPSFYARRGRYHYWQIIVKSKSRKYLLELAQIVPADWTVDLDPTDLL